eukprot:CAMPEP_0172581440 /NCGR_PEP_ID=MMETSP1068-20121228/658_1 /TAXON_ID=35684 /ORGANISM="Pseudopedinella elastica, Strain CCMP716" /LENGTH=49 /DNA_ID= /DNA_START= /DNA_END= /DNA_ORIENTATION=
MSIMKVSETLASATSASKPVPSGFFWLSLLTMALDAPPRLANSASKPVP